MKEIKCPYCKNGRMDTYPDIYNYGARTMICPHCDGTGRILVSDKMPEFKR